MRIRMRCMRILCMRVVDEEDEDEEEEEEEEESALGDLEMRDTIRQQNRKE